MRLFVACRLQGQGAVRLLSREELPIHIMGMGLRGGLADRCPGDQWLPAVELQSEFHRIAFLKCMEGMDQHQMITPGLNSRLPWAATVTLFSRSMRTRPFTTWVL